MWIKAPGSEKNEAGHSNLEIEYILSGIGRRYYIFLLQGLLYLKSGQTRCVLHNSTSLYSLYLGLYRWSNWCLLYSLLFDLLLHYHDL